MFLGHLLSKDQESCSALCWEEGQLGWIRCLCCLSLRDSPGPGKPRWMPVLGCSQLGDVTSGSLGVEGPDQPCRKPQARPRTQVQAHGALQPLYTQRATLTDTHSLFHSLLLRSLSPPSPHIAHHSRPPTPQRDPGFQPLQLPRSDVLGSQRGDPL